jgi:hypothetical protein
MAHIVDSHAPQSRSTERGNKFAAAKVEMMHLPTF